MSELVNEKKEPYLGNPKETIEVLKKYNFNFQKNLDKTF